FSEAIGRFFDERADVHRCEILPLELACDRVQLVQAHRRLTSRRAASEESPDIVFDLVEGGAVFATSPNVRKSLGELRDRAADAVGIAARDDQRVFLAEGFLDDLDQPFAWLKCRTRPLL